MKSFKLAFFILVFYSTRALCENVPQQQIKLERAAFTPFLIGKGQKNEPTIYAINQKGQLTETNAFFMDSAISTGIAAAKKATCSLKIKPDQVSVTMGFFSATWDTKKFCE